MSVAGHYFVVLTKVFFNGFSLSRALHNYQVFLHNNSMFVLLRRKSKQKIAYTLLYSNNFRYFNKTEGFPAKTMSISCVFSLYLSEMKKQVLLLFVNLFFDI